MTKSVDSKAAGSRCPVRLALGRLEFLVGKLATAIRRPLPPVPPLASLADVKQFCVGLLQPNVDHPWREQLTPLSSRDFHTVAHTLFLFRKCIPGLTSDPVLRQAEADYLLKMSRPPPPIPDSLRLSLRKTMKGLFRPGWDKGYSQRIPGLHFGMAGCLEVKGSEGGARENGPRSLLRVQRVAQGVGVHEDPGVARVVAIADGGKPRVVTVSSFWQYALKPLHDHLYSHLSRFPWLLRGDALPSSFGFTHVPGEVFVSGDYESATDNISLELIEEVLSCLRELSPNIPKSVWDYASFRSRLSLETGTSSVKQTNGQLMGNFLSFPFLCLINYIVFKWCVPRSGVPVKINGDDIVFRCNEAERSRWFSRVGDSGLVCSIGKTYVHHSFFSLNSSMFYAGVSEVHQVPFIRPRSFFSKAKDISDLVGTFSTSFPGFRGESLRPLQVSFLQRNRSLIGLCQRSLTRCLGMRISIATLRSAGLWKRERYYLGEPNEPPPPPELPEPGKTVASSVTHEYHSVVVRGDEVEKEKMREVGEYFHISCREAARRLPVQAPGRGLSARVLGGESGRAVVIERKRDWLMRLRRGTSHQIFLKPGLSKLIKGLRIGRKELAFPLLVERVMLPRLEGNCLGLGYWADLS